MINEYNHDLYKTDWRWYEDGYEVTRTSVWTGPGCHERLQHIDIRLNPSDAENYKTRAEIHMDKGEYDDSLADLQTAIKLDSHADVYDLMMQLLEANPDPAFFDKVTSCYQGVTANR